MTTATLKQGLGDGGAHIGNSHGSDNLYAVLKAFAKSATHAVTGGNVTPAVETLDQFTAAEDTYLQSLTVGLNDTGSAGATVVEVELNGVTILTNTVDNTDDSQVGHVVRPAAPILIPGGSLIELLVTAIPTAGVNVVATAQLSPVIVE